MNLNTFISNVKSGLARNNHFLVQLALPSKIATSDPTKSNLNKILLFCDQAQLPGISYGTNQVRTYGEFRETPYEKLYEPVTLSFYVDKDLYVKKMFEEWINLIQNRETRDFEYPVNYMTDVEIFVLDVEDNQKYLVKLKNAYPKAISAIQLDYASKDVMKLQVTMTYKYYEDKLYTASSDRDKTDVISKTRTQLAGFDYGFSAFEIPGNYFNDFMGFQNQFSDFSLEGARALNAVENIGERIGLGNIFT